MYEASTSSARRGVKRYPAEIPTVEAGPPSPNDPLTTPPRRGPDPSG